MARLAIQKLVPGLLGLSLIVLFLSGCSSISKMETIDGEDIARQHELDGELLYQLLAGEFAGVRGDYEGAVRYYLQAASNTHDPQVAARAAHVALYSGHYSEALNAVQRWEALSPEDPAITRIKALTYIHLEKVEPALEIIDQLIMIDGKVDDDEIGSLGHILQKEAKPAIALELLVQLNERHPQQVRLLLLQARLEANAGHHHEAMEVVEKIIVLAPEISDVYLIKAQILAALDQDEQAVAAVAIAVEKRPHDTRLRLQYARMLVQMRQYELAWDQFLQLKLAMPDNEDVLLTLGLIAIEIDKIDQAKQYLQELIDKGYHNSQAHYYLGRIQQSQGEILPAITNYERVHDGDFLLDARIRVAGLLAQIGKVEEALQKLNQLTSATQNSINQIKVYLAQGEVLRQAHREQEAMKIYSDALKDSPENIDLLYARALTAEKLDMLDITESDLRMVLMHEPDNANALNALGYTLADRTERLQEAKEYILKAARLLPDDPAVLDSLGWVYYRLGEMDKSISWLRKAFAKLEDAEIAAHLGEVLWVNGQLEEAEKIWQRGLDVKADHPLLLQTIKRLKK